MVKVNNFEILSNDFELNNIIDSINKNNKYLFACHGRYHTMFVVNMVEYILTELNYDNKIIENSKIAGLLHDIGTIDGKKNHAKKSSIMCMKFLDKINILNKDKDIISQAIDDHSNGNNICSVIGAVVLIADKINLVRDRVLEEGYKDKWHKNLIEIEEIKVNIINNIIIIDYITSNKFSKEILLKEWYKGYLIPIKGIKYLNLDYSFRINGCEINF